MTPARTGQYIHKSIRWWVTRTDTCQSGLHFHFELLLKAHRSYIGMGKHDPFPGLQSKLSLSFRSFRLAVQTLCRKRWLCGEQLWVLQWQVSVRRDTTTPSAARPVWPVSWLPSLLLPLFVFPPCRSITYTSVTLVSVTTESTNKAVN